VYDNDPHANTEGVSPHCGDGSRTSDAGVGLSYWTSSVAKSGGTVTLIAGQYIPVLENDSGVFYKGPAQCLVFRGKSVFGDHEHFSQDGGIWLPKEPSQHPRSFAFSESLQIFGAAGTGATTTSPALQTGLRSIPSGASPGAAGVGVALGLAIVELLSRNEQDPQRIHFAFDPIGDGSHVRKRFRAPE
jgi:hypothetical protein